MAANFSRYFAMFLPQSNWECYLLRMYTSYPFLVSAAVAAFTAFTAQSAVASGNEVGSVEFPVETEALVNATAEYFDGLSASAAGPEVKAPVIRMPRLARKVSVELEADHPLTMHGPLSHLTGYRINWYPTDRFLGSVDFMGTWDGNRNLVCGYLLWDLSDPSQPVLDTVSANYVDMGELAEASAADVHETLLEANCAFGAVEANYAYFDPLG